jgi:hypothetical protein
MGGGPTDETAKTESRCNSRCGMIKIPPCPKVLSAELRPKFCSISPAMIKVKIFCAGRKTVINQSIDPSIHTVLKYFQLLSKSPLISNALGKGLFIITGLGLAAVLFGAYSPPRRLGQLEFHRFTK